MKMYCIFARESIDKMKGNRGKLAAQAGHAYLHAYWDAEMRFRSIPWDTGFVHPDEPIVTPSHNIYRHSMRATKVCLVVDTVEELIALEEAYRPICGVSLVTDAAFTVFSEPTTTCLGIGPLPDDMKGEDLARLKTLV